VLSAPEGLRFAENYVAGAQAAARSLGLGAPIVHRCEMTEAEGEAVAGRILSRGGRPALACIQDSLAFGAFRAATAIGCRIGADATLCGGQNFPGSEHTAPPLTTFSTEDARVAELLSRVMLARLEGQRTEPYESFVVAPKLLLRASHRPALASAPAR
jgi:LacI family transcriptional regulator